MAMKDGINTIEEKAISFSLRIINLYKLLVKQGEFVLSKQILRSGTSVGANISESGYNSITRDCVELIKILTSIILSSKKKVTIKL